MYKYRRLIQIAGHAGSLLITFGVYWFLLTVAPSDYLRGKKPLAWLYILGASAASATVYTTLTTKVDLMLAFSPPDPVKDLLKSLQDNKSKTDDDIL